MNQFLPTTIGSANDRKFRVHAAATNGLLYFGSFLLGRFGAALGPMLAHWRCGLDSLIRIQESIKTHPRRYPPEAVQSFVDDVHLHFGALRHIGIPFKPKHHLLAEMSSRLSFGKKGCIALVNPSVAEAAVGLP